MRLILIIILTTGFVFTAQAELPIIGEESCLQNGGTWDDGSGTCLYPIAPDAGEACENHSDCTYECYAILTEKQEDLITHEPYRHILDVKGTCTTQPGNIPCMGNIEDGKVTAIICE